VQHISRAQVAYCHRFHSLNDLNHCAMSAQGITIILIPDSGPKVGT